MSNRRYPRTARVNEVVLEALANELERLSDPRLELVTLTGVDVSPDLRSGKVFYSTLGEKDEARDALRAAKRHLQAVVGRNVRLKYLPILEFQEDPAMVAGQRIEEIIRDVHAHDSAQLRSDHLDDN